jgi:hypothetical protein
MSEDFTIEMDEYSFMDMYPERPVDYEGMYEVIDHYNDLMELEADYDPGTSMEDYLNELRAAESVHELASTPSAPVKSLTSPPPPPLKGPRPYSYDDLDLLPVKRRLFV